MGAAAGRRGQLIDVGLAAAGLLYSGLLAVMSFEYTIEARVFALVAAGAGIATSATYLVLAFRDYLTGAEGHAPDGGAGGRSRDRIRLAALSTLVVLSIGILYAFGVYAFSFAFTAVFLRLYAKHTWRTVAAMATGLTIFNYLMFGVLFDLRFDSVGVLLP